MNASLFQILEFKSKSRFHVVQIHDSATPPHVRFQVRCVWFMETSRSHLNRVVSDALFCQVDSTASEV